MGHLSSIARATMARPDTISTPGVAPYCGRKIATASAKPTNMARPPRVGVGLLCACLPPGWAIQPKRRER